MQELGYPELGPLRSPLQPDHAYQLAKQIAFATPDWVVVRQDEKARTLQAIAISRLFRFRDDVIIRVRADGAGSRIDLRSRSRVGRGDMGANAARIAAFQERFASETPAP